MKILLVDLTYLNLSTDGINRGDRVYQICKYWAKDNRQIKIFSTNLAILRLKKTVKNLSNISFKVFDGREKQIKFRYQVIFDYMKKTFFSPFVKIDKDLDVIYTLTGLFPDVFFAFCKKMFNPRIKWAAHVDNLVWAPWKRPGAKKISNFLIYSAAFTSFLLTTLLLRKADLVLTVSEDVSLGLQRVGIKKERISISSNGIDFSMISNYDNFQSYDAVFLGRVELAKGIIDLIKAWSIVVKDCGQAKLAVIGAVVDPLKTNIENLVKELNLVKNIDFLGAKFGQEKYKLLQNGKIFVSPSYDESFGQTVLEACACGLPVVAYNLDVYKKLYPENLIQVVELSRVDLLAKKISTLLKDASLRQELSEKAKKDAASKRWDIILEKELELILN